MMMILINRILNHANFIGTLLGVAGVICIATGVVLAVSSELGSSATAFWRFFLGSLACGSLTIYVLGGRAWGHFRELAGKTEVWISGLSFGLAIAFWYAGMERSSIATTSTFHNLSPLVLVLAGWLFIGRRVSLQIAAGLLLAIAGAGWLALQGTGLTGQSLTGDVLALTSAMFMAAFYFCLTRLSAETHPWAVMTIVSMISAVALLGIALASEDRLMPKTASGWGMVVALGVCGQVLGQSLLA